MSAEATSRQIQELQRLRFQQHLWQIGIALTLLLLVTGGLLSMRNAVGRLATDEATRELFAKELTTRLENGALPAVQELGTGTLRQINFPAEFGKLNARTPEIADATMKELDQLRENLPRRGQKVLNDAVQGLLKQREAKIREMFPEATEEQVTKMGANLGEEAQLQVVGITDALFSPHQKSLENIVTHLTTIQDAEKSAGRRDIPTWEMTLLVFDIAHSELKSLQPPPKALAKSAPKPAGGKK